MFQCLYQQANRSPKWSLLLLTLLLIALDLLFIHDLTSLATLVQGQRFWVNLALSGLTLLLSLYAFLPFRARWLRILGILLILIPQAVQLSYFKTYASFISLYDVYFLMNDPILSMQLGMENTPWLRIGLLLAIELPILILVFNLALKPHWLARIGNGFFALVFFAVITLSWYSTAKFQFSSVAFWSLMPAMVERYALEVDNQIQKPTLAYKSQADKDAPNIVFIVGESLNSVNMSLYGYQRKTTPKLDALAQTGKLLAMKNAVSTGTRTISSVPHMLTGFQGIDPKGKIYSVPTIFNYAKAAGYHTGFITAQELKWRNLDQLLIDKDVDVFKNGTQFSAKVDVLSGVDDMQLLKQGVLPFIQQAKSKHKPYFLVVQMNGSHYPYNTHSPKYIKQFLPEKEENGLNAYDNTVLYSDLFLSSLFKALDTRHTWAFYSSDHGQGVKEEHSRFNRGFEKQVIFNPLLVFASPENIQRLKQNEHRPVSQADIFYTILGLLKMSPITPATGLDMRSLIAAKRLRVVSRYTKILHNDPFAAIVLPNRDFLEIDFQKENVLLPDGNSLVPYSQLPKSYQEFAEGKRFNLIDTKQYYLPWQGDMSKSNKKTHK